MVRFYFHLASKDGNIILDTKGYEFSDLATAHRHAVMLINKMVLLTTDVEWQGWSMKVTNENNRSILSVLFPPGPYVQRGGKTARSRTPG
jgi:hypothetical protein